MSNERYTSADRWIHWTLCALAFAIPLLKKFVPGLIVLLALFIIARIVMTRKIHMPDKSLWLLLGIFLLHLFGITYSEHKEDAWREVGIKLSYLAFPIMAVGLPRITTTQSDEIKRWFVRGCLSFIAVAISFGVYRSFVYHDIGYLSYQLLGINYHPTYAAAYQALALFILLSALPFGGTNYRKQSLILPASFCIVVFVSMLASKAGILAILLSIAAGAFLYWKHSKLLMRSVLLTVMLSLVSIGSSILIPGASGRLQGALQDVEHTAVPSEDEQTVAVSSTALRLITWRASWNVLKSQPLGAGTGDTTPELVKQYKQMGEDYAAEKNLNSHNQYLQIAAEHGWPGLIMLLAVIAVVAMKCFSSKDFFMLHFLVVCCMNFLFESFLEVQAGIVFFCFWIFIQNGSRD